jgi:hypothetical protein
MKRLIPILSATCVLGALICSVFLMQTNWSFSLLFKSILLFLSAAIGLIAYWKSQFKPVLLIAGIICFGGLCYTISNSLNYQMMWNYILAGHVLLIGYTLFQEARTAPSNFLKNSAQVSVLVAMVSFATAVLFKIQQEWVYSTLMVLLFVMSILLLVNKLMLLFRK